MNRIEIIGLIMVFGLFSSLNAQEQKAELYVQTGHSEQINNIALASDSSLMVSSSEDGTIKLWEVETRREIRTFKAKTENSLARAATISSDGKMVAGIWENIIKVWDVETGTELITFSHKSKEIQRFSNGQIYTVDDLNGIGFSPDGKLLATAGKDGKIKLWSIEKKQELETLSGHSSWCMEAVFSPNGSLLATSSGDKTVILWDVSTKRKLRILQGHSASVFGIAFNHNGTLLASASEDKTAKLWDVASGNELKTFLAHEKAVGSVNFLQNANILVTAGEDETIKLWNIETGKLVKTLSENAGEVSSFVVTKDEKTIISASFYSVALRFWNIETGDSELADSYYSNDVSRLLLSSDEKKLASVNGSNILIWNIGDETQLITLTGHQAMINSISFSEDGKFLASVSFDKTVKIWDVLTGREIKSLTAESECFFMAHFSKDGKYLVTQDCAEKKKYQVWDVQTWNQINSFTDSAKVVKIVPNFFRDMTDKVSTKDGRFRLEPGVNGRIVFFDRQTNKELCSLIGFGLTLGSNLKNWVIQTPEGLFDGTQDAWKQVIWRFDNNTFSYAPVEAFFKEFYYPGLLQEIMQGKIPTPPEKDLSQVDIRQPNLKISEIDGKPTDSNASANKSTVKVKVEIADNANKGRKESFPASSGANDVRLFRNGSLVKLWENDAFNLTEKDGCKQFAATKDAPRKVVCETDVQITADKNEFVAYAFNHDNVKSNDAFAEIKGAETLKRKGKLQILSVGVNEYQNKDFNLKFAVADAVDFGTELRNRQINLKNFDAPEVLQLTDKEATKQNILYALERFAKGEKAVKPANLSVETDKKIAAIEKTQPEDVLVIYFAGHGTASKDRFYLIPHDGFPSDSTGEQSRIELLQKQSISDLELEATFRDLDAGQILFVIDACNSGQALEAEEKRRGPMNSRGLAQLAFEKGMYILTAAQSFQAALEVSRTPDGKKIEHGLLTFSLLDGFANPKADTDADKSITEREWFSFAAGEVPRMQLEEMQKRSGIYMVNGDKEKDANKRALQTPRVFYRRESSANPFVVSKF